MVFRLRYLLAGIMLFSGSLIVRGQATDCDQTLSHAESEFTAGHFYAIPSLLQKCLNDGLSRDQSIRAYLLLCQVYLIIDDPIAAEDSYLKLLSADPEYVTDERKDPIDVVYLSKKFTATPIFTPHFRIGLNSSIYRSIYSMSTNPYPVDTQNFLRINVQGGAGLDWNINDNVSVGIEGNFGTRAFRREINGLAGNNLQTHLSSQLWADVPLYLKYSASQGAIRPFGYAGIALNFLISSKSTFTYKDVKPDLSQILAEGPSESVTYQSNRLNHSFVIGGGIKYKVGKDFIYADLRYMGSLSNLTNVDKLYYGDPASAPANGVGNPNLFMASNVTKYVYVADLFRLDNVSLSFGFIHPIYDPRRIKKARTKSVSRKIKREEGGKDK
jgi:hypothetical protein